MWFEECFEVVVSRDSSIKFFRLNIESEKAKTYGVVRAGNLVDILLNKCYIYNKYQVSLMV